MGEDTGGELRETLARNVRMRRQQLGLSQEALGELAGLHRTYIGAVERSERNLSVDNIEKLARALGMAPSELLSNTAEVRDYGARESSDKPDGTSGPDATT
jgi:transcriptional regulator with XRE-family HTH domain